MVKKFLKVCFLPKDNRLPGSPSPYPTTTLQVISHLDKINNFNSLMAISAGLNNSAIHRLKFTMDDLPAGTKQEWQEIQDKMATDNNSRIYRERLRQSTPPVMPYLGIYLTDITFIEDGNPDDLPSGEETLINFRKRELVFRVIDEIQRYQQTPYKTEVDPSMLSAIQELPFNSDDDLYALSLQREPRGTANRATIQWLGLFECIYCTKIVVYLPSTSPRVGTSPSKWSFIDIRDSCILYSLMCKMFPHSKPADAWIKSVN